jgi:hypothetical protein
MIQFTTGIDPQMLNMAFNNSIIRFYSNVIVNPMRCEITGLVTTGTITLFPNPVGHFFFNFKPYVSAIINTGNFQDTVTPALAAGAESFVYNVTNSVYLQGTVNIKIFNANDASDEYSVTLRWLAGVQQLGDATQYALSDTVVLSAHQKNNTRACYLKYWQGYPFDIPVYANAARLTLKNETNLLTWQFDLAGVVNRIFISDGRTDESLENLLPLATGHNRLRIKRSVFDADTDAIINLQKVPYKCGVYLKWLNALGGYNYWLFEDTYSIDRTTKYLGELDRDNDNLNQTFARTTQIGKESTDTLKVVAELLTEDENRIVQGILDSPKVYLFTGQPYAQNGARNWVEVALKTTGARIKNPRQPLTNFTFDVELPARYMQTL